MPLSNEAEQDLRRELVEIRADLIVTQGALAVALAGIARLTASPVDRAAEDAVRILGFADAAASGMAGGIGRPTRITEAALRLAGWIEGMARERHGGSGMIP